MPIESIKTCNAKINMKKKISLKNSKYEYYRVQKFEEGEIKFEYRELAVPFEISQSTLNMIDSAIKNLQNKKVSEPVDLTEFRA